MTYYTPAQVYDSLVDQGYSEDKALALSRAMGDQRYSGEDLQRGYAAIGAQGAALPTGKHGGTDTPVWTNVGDAIGGALGSRFGQGAWLLGGLVGSRVGEEVSGENYYERAGWPAMGAEVGLSLGLGTAAERVGRGWDTARRAAFNRKAAALKLGQLVEHDPKLRYLSLRPDKKFASKHRVNKANRKLVREVAKAAAKKGVPRFFGGRVGGAIGGALGSIVPGAGTALGAAIGSGLGLLGGGLLADWIMPDQQKSVEEDENMGTPGEAANPWKGTGALGAMATGALALSPYGRALGRRAVGKLPGTAGARRALENFESPLSKTSSYQAGMAAKRAEQADLDPPGAFKEKWRDMSAERAGRVALYQDAGSRLHNLIRREPDYV